MQRPSSSCLPRVPTAQVDSRGPRCSRDVDPGLFVAPRVAGSPPAGFTLAEVLAAVAAVGILAAIATAAYGGTIHASRAAEARAAMLDTYQVAIRHATTRGVHVVACPALVGGGCLDTIDWSRGWRAFEDRDRDRRFDAGERIVGRWPALGARAHLRSTSGRKQLTFQPSGGNTGSNVTLTLCDGRGADKATRLVLSNDGRLREMAASPKAAAACMVPST